MFGDEKVQDRLELPEPVTLLGVTVHEVVFVPMLTTPEKPFALVTVTVELPDVPTSTVMAEGLAAIVKSCVA
jgi:hypothetical protein